MIFNCFPLSSIGKKIPFLLDPIVILDDIGYTIVVEVDQPTISIAENYFYELDCYMISENIFNIDKHLRNVKHRNIINYHFNIRQQI